MPRIYRVMKTLDAKPETGSGSCMLGARERDLGREEAPADDFVEPPKAGLSVGGCLRTNSFNFLPQRLAKIYPQWARGFK